MVEFRWLHITDLHTGMEESEHLWPNVEDKFHEDLSFLLKKVGGPLDMVIFTGDFVQRGVQSEFDRVEAILEKLWQQFDQKGPKPFLLAVPGNHDLVRPVNTVDNPNPALDTLMYLWDSKKHIRNAFWNNPASPQRHVVDEAFTNYVDWYQNVSMPKPDTHSQGMLPGDFSATIEKDGVKLGVVGLNSTYLQLAGGNFQRKLELSLRQFQAACHNHGPDWSNGHRVCLLLTHHPPDWLSDKAQNDLAEIHNPPHRFALHLYGHMHEPQLRQEAMGGAEARNHLQGCSLFGLENWGEEEKTERIHGYSIGKLTIKGNTGKWQIWPRKAIPQQGGWDIEKDTTFTMPKDKLAISPKNIKLLKQNVPLEPPKQPYGRDLPQFRSIQQSIDPILLARLDALKDKLLRIPGWLRSDLDYLAAERRSKQKLESEVDRAVNTQLNKVRGVYRILTSSNQIDEKTLNDAWGTYCDVNNRSIEIFRECLELMGGLALRRKNLDDSICWLADKIVSECATKYLHTMFPSVTVLARQEAVHRTMARIVRLRFPEWTVWSLPFAAHEFGHVVIEEDDVTLRPFVESHSQEWGRYHIYEIVADAFATYVMGPAFVCAAIMLRFDPLSTSDQMRLADTNRAAVSFSVLEWMNNEARNDANKPLKPYSDIIQYLRQQWQGALRRAGAPAALQKKGPNPEDKQLRELVNSMMEEFRDLFRENGQYPPMGDNGFTTANQWAEDWRQQVVEHPNSNRLPLPEISPESTLRDALNAAWLCRMHSDPIKLDLIDNAAYRLCVKIIENSEPPTDLGSVLPTLRQG